MRLFDKIKCVIDVIVKDKINIVKDKVSDVKDKLNNAEDKVYKYIYDKKFKYRDKQREKENKKFEEFVLKFIKRDLSDEASNWKFYIPKDNGKYDKKPISQKEFKQIFETDKNDPRLKDAIVVDENGYLVRIRTWDRRGNKDSKTKFTNRHLTLDKYGNYADEYEKDITVGDGFTSFESNAVPWEVSHNHGTTLVWATTESIALARFKDKYPTYQVSDIKRC